VLKLLFVMCLPLLFLLPTSQNQDDDNAPAIIYVLGLLIFLLYVGERVY